jgi:hypothetical protein
MDAEFVFETDNGLQKGYVFNPTPIAANLALISPVAVPADKVKLPVGYAIKNGDAKVSGISILPVFIKGSTLLHTNTVDGQSTKTKIDRSGEPAEARVVASLLKEDTTNSKTGPMVQFKTVANLTTSLSRNSKDIMKDARVNIPYSTFTDLSSVKEPILSHYKDTRASKALTRQKMAIGYMEKMTEALEHTIQMRATYDKKREYLNNQQALLAKAYGQPVSEDFMGEYIRQAEKAQGTIEPASGAMPINSVPVERNQTPSKNNPFSNMPPPLNKK